ncbi:MAG: FAD-dependent oxidoreductase [Thermodesulfobacteriota bacterium]|nr:FAD-dependent oxidoreductase [Thermodesulfobacteriota bacterium]
MKQESSMLFSPIYINNLEVKNRIAYPSLGLVYSYDRKLNSRYVEFYKARAAGGAGIVTVGPCGVDFIGSGIAFLAIDNDEAITSFQELTSEIKNAGAKSWIQLFHSGAYTHPFLIDGKEPMAPSAVYSKYSKTTPKEMTPEDIENVIDAFAKAANRAKKAGFDGVEIIGSAGYLITQFLSPKTNQRTDEYGGTIDKRLKFPVDVIKRVRKEVGPDYPVTIRVAGNDFVENSNTSKEAAYFAKAYEESSIDAINVTGGWHETKVPQLPSVLPESGFTYLALNIKRAVSVPVMASNRISSPLAAEKILRDGCADMVNLGRVLIADPEWPLKAEHGRYDEIRPCVACSQLCTDEVFSGRPVGCIGNPLAGFEKERKLEKSDISKRVLVAGAGPAGLEAAITAAKRGHKVEIYEKSGSIGGQLPLAAAPPHKNEFAEFIRYYKTMVKKYRIDLFLNSEVDMELIKKRNPDFIVAATGAEPVMPPFKGIDDPGVISAWDFLKNDSFVGKNIAVIGGGAVGLETALFAASKGTISPETLEFLFSYNAEEIEVLKELLFKGSVKVTVFELLAKVGKDVGKSTKWVLLDNLKKHGVDIITEAEVLSVANRTVLYKKDSKEQSMEFDSLVIAAGSKPVNSLGSMLKSSKYSFTEIGDCTTPGNVGHAIHGGYLAALKI